MVAGFSRGFKQMNAELLAEILRNLPRQ
jgi:hypothetical protein